MNQAERKRIEEIRARAKRDEGGYKGTYCHVDWAQMSSDRKRMLRYYDKLAEENERLRASLQDAQTSTPLTLEELRELDGEAVWIEDLLLPECSAWHFVCRDDDEIRAFDRQNCENKWLGYNATTGENYGETWLAYNRKPKEKPT